MKINYLSLKEGTPASPYWDQEFLHDILSSIPDSDRKVFVIPGAYQGDIIPAINKYLSAFPKIMVFITSDEEGAFNVSKLKHPDMIVYSEYGTSKNIFPIGYTPQTRPTLKELGLQPKTLKWFFSGQITHNRRRLMAEYLKAETGGLFNSTGGFAQGMEFPEYFTNMAQANAVMCPPGALVQESFRVYETLESGSIPIVDKHSSQGNSDFWQRNFPDAPFPIIDKYDELHDQIEMANVPFYINMVFAWWIAKKYEIKQKLAEQFEVPLNDMSVIIPVSPIKSHPDDSILVNTVKSIRAHTDAPIYITFDGVRQEQFKMSARYDEFVRRFLWRCNFEFENVIPILFPGHTHQVGMARKALQMINTPLILYVEQDTPLVTDEVIEWDKIKKFIMEDHANVVRFHFEAQIPDAHRHLMIGSPEDGFLKTVQWSQRPHVASADFYRKMLDKSFSLEAKCFIEDKIHGMVQDDWMGHKEDIGWNMWKLWIYHPNDVNIKRSLHTDGRGGGKKYDDKQIF